jgi:hypothetical protein
MKWLLLFLATSAFANENNAQLDERLLGPAEPSAIVEMAGDSATTDVAVPARPIAQKSKGSVVSASGLTQTMMSLWPLFVVILAGGGLLVMRKKGIAVPGLTKAKLTPKVPMKVVSRNSLGGNACILLVDVEGADGEVRRLLLGTGGNATPSLVQDLGSRGGKKAAQAADAVPESIQFTMRQEPTFQKRPEPAIQAPIPKRASGPVPTASAIPTEQPVNNTPEFDDHEYVAEGVEPGSDPLNTRLRRVHRHRHPGGRSAARTVPKQSQNENWRVNSFAAGMPAENESGPLDEGVTVKVSAQSSHLESFAAKHQTESPEPKTAAPRVQKVEDPQERKRLDVSNAFEAELRRRVYDASPGERKARSEAARALVDQMIQERMSQARSA